MCRRAGLPAGDSVPRVVRNWTLRGLAAAAISSAIVGCSSARPLTVAEWYRGAAYCGHLKLEAFLRNGHLTAAQQAAVRGTLSADPGYARRRPIGFPVDCGIYKFRITVHVSRYSSDAGIESDPPPCSALVPGRWTACKH